MKKSLYLLCAAFICAMMLTACKSAWSWEQADSRAASRETLENATSESATLESATSENATSESAVSVSAVSVSAVLESPMPERPGVSLPQAVLDSYYSGQDSPAFEYFQHSSIKKFLAMWVKEETGDLDQPVWDYDSFTKIQRLDHDFTAIRPEEVLYCLPFSDGAGRYGYVIAAYNEDDPSISNQGVVETTPYQYDLKGNMKEIAVSLMKTDIDLPTAKASRVYLYDREKKRADQVIRFTDSKGDDYICYYGDAAFEIEKW